MIEHIDAQKQLLNVEINMIDDAALSITQVSSFLEIETTNVMDALGRERNKRVQRMENLEKRLQDLAGERS